MTSGDGCHVHPHCLSCPLPACVYDDEKIKFIFGRDYQRAYSQRLEVKERRRKRQANPAHAAQERERWRKRYRNDPAYAMRERERARENHRKNLELKKGL